MGHKGEGEKGSLCMDEHLPSLVVSFLFVCIIRSRYLCL